MAKHYELGKEGESIAVNFLQKEGYAILDRNWRYQKAEIDIIAQKLNELIAVEVKTRSTTNFGNPQDFVNPKKIQLLVTAMNEYVLQRDLDVEVRFDIISYTLERGEWKLERLPNGFYPF